jgi:hypothetical protein
MKTDAMISAISAVTTPIVTDAPHALIVDNALLKTIFIHW